jgi:Caspase domain
MMLMRSAPLVFAHAAILMAGSTAIAAPGSPESKDEIYAVVVGHNGGRSGLPPLRFADDDALRFSLMFSSLSSSSGNAGRVWLLSTVDSDTERTMAKSGLSLPSRQPPTRRALFDTLDDLKRVLSGRPAGGNRILYFVYAGHGQNGQLLLQPEQAEEAAVTGIELRTALAAVAQIDPGLRIFVFVDACRSQSLFSERGPRTGPDFSGEIAALEKGANAAQIGVLTAATSGKPAAEVADLRAGLFSHALASGLSGVADADGNEIVTFGELVAFVALNTRSMTGQSPWFDPPNGDLNRTTIDHRGRLPQILVRATEAGKYRVETETGRPIFAEAFVARGHTVKLTLPVGRYRILRAPERGQPGEASETLVDLGAGQLLDTGASNWQSSHDFVVTDRGNEGEFGFDAPFTPDVVATLEVGYTAGLAPSTQPDASNRRLSLGYTIGSAPLGLGGVAQGLTLRSPSWYVGSIGLGARALSMWSTHLTGTEQFDLMRLTFLIEGSYEIALPARVTLAILGGAGGTTVVHTAHNAASKGEWFAPSLMGGIELSGRLGMEFGWALGGLLTMSWIDVDGAPVLTNTFVSTAGLWWQW